MISTFNSSECNLKVSSIPSRTKDNSVSVNPVAVEALKMMSSFVSKIAFLVFGSIDGEFEYKVACLLFCLIQDLETSGVLKIIHDEARVTNIDKSTNQKTLRMTAFLHNIFLGFQNESTKFSFFHLDTTNSNASLVSVFVVMAWSFRSKFFESVG